MKKLLILAYCLTIFSSIYAQGLSSASSFNAALERAANKKLYVLLIVNAYKELPPIITANASTIPSGIEDKEVINKIEQNFIVYRTDRKDTNITDIVTKYKLQIFPAYLFMHPNKEVFFSDYGNFPKKEKYFTMIQKALDAVNNESPISALEAAYALNKSDIGILKQLIIKRISKGIRDNAALIETYVTNLKIGDFNNYDVVKFILEAGPYADGLAYRLASTNRKIIDSIYKREPLAVRSSLNSNIIDNTYNDAVKTRNINRARAASNFLRSTWNSDFNKSQQYSEKKMLDYYFAVKDTSNYLRTAVNHYDRFYMNQSAASIKEMENKALENIKAKVMTLAPVGTTYLTRQQTDSLLAKTNVKQTLPAGIDTSKMVRRVREFRTIETKTVLNTYANGLNEAAWNFYLTGTNNINFLVKAMVWSRRSIELNEVSTNYDTLAHILYKIGFNQEAINIEETAIIKGQAEKKNVEPYLQVLKKIKAGNL